MAKMQPDVFSEKLRQAVERSGLTRYRLWQETEISQSVLSRFMSRQVKDKSKKGRVQGLSLANIDVLCEYLRLDLVERKSAGKGQKAPRT